MAEPRKVIRDYRFEPEAALNKRKVVIAQEQRRYNDDPRLIVDGGNRVIPPYYPREPIPAGDELSPSGTFIAFEELDAELQALILAGGGGGAIRVREADGSPDIDPTDTITVPNDTLTAGAPGEAILDFNAFELREVFLEFSGQVAPGTAINIQTGVYAGAGSPATVRGDTNVTLPSSGATYADDGRIEITLNGQELEKGAGLGQQEAQWMSSTQIALSIRILPGNVLAVKAPFPTA